ncbi:MAG: hypothetical protein HOW73_20655 [Polyangiaceae bacterium]|nr:hypothetical protein [Polyangiaceae bacterium]
MPLERQLLTPISIVIAGGLIGLGLFFGLRTPTAQPSSSAVSASAPIHQPATEAATAAGSAASLELQSTKQEARSALASADHKQVERDALAALERQRKVIVDACFSPALAKKPEPSPIKLRFNYAFGADGKQLGRGVAIDRGNSRSDVTNCILEKLPAISIPAPGSVVTVDVPWTLP